MTVTFGGYSWSAKFGHVL